MTAAIIEVDDIAMGNSSPHPRAEPEAMGECKSKADP